LKNESEAVNEVRLATYVTSGGSMSNVVLNAAMQKNNYKTFLVSLDKNRPTAYHFCYSEYRIGLVV